MSETASLRAPDKSNGSETTQRATDGIDCSILTSSLDSSLPRALVLELPPAPAVPEPYMVRATVIHGRLNSPHLSPKLRIPSGFILAFITRAATDSMLRCVLTYLGRRMYGVLGNGSVWDFSDLSSTELS